MAISSRTDWSKIRYYIFIIISVCMIVSSATANGLTGSRKQKRQLFREQLLPEHGGKIPETAFNPQRLRLNKYNQNGFFTEDGWHLEQRHPNDVHLPKKYLPNTLKINLPPDNTHVAPPGRQHTFRSVDTTYLIREPVNYVIFPRHFHHQSVFPFIPHDLLRTVRKYKYDKKNYYHSHWNEVLPTANQILQDLAPYLHKSDYYG